MARRRPSVIRRLAALAALWLAAGAARAADDAARVTAVQPLRADGVLMCRLTTAGLPGERLLSTLHSGLTSAVDLNLALLDARGRTVAGNLVTLRLSYDLWDEEFTVRADGDAVRLADDAALRAWLASPPLLPVAPLRAIAGTEPLRLRAALRLHAIAPEAREEAEALVAGPDGQEVSLAVGTLVRLFYRGDGAGEDAGAALSPAFRPGELDHAPH